MRNSNSVCLNGRPFHDDLAARLGRTVKIANDADCFALSEATDGAAAGAASVFGVILGTGVGGGIVIHGRLHRGPNAIAGEWGHNSLPRPTADELKVPPCYCGRVGCIETLLSGPALKAEGDSDEALERYEDRLARALSSVINILDPEVIVLGGVDSRPSNGCTPTCRCSGSATCSRTMWRRGSSRRNSVKAVVCGERHGWFRKC